VADKDAGIEIKFNNLLARVELETGRRPTQAEVAETVGIAESTLSRFVQGKSGRLDARILIGLVDYFDKRLENGCTLADLIAYPPEESQDIVDAQPALA
jgi:transcriptional regulator with XRE-family HTH domain